MNSYVVIGLGLFGYETALCLYSLGEEVLAIDIDEQLVDRIADRVTRAVAADARDLNVLQKLGVQNFDRAVVAIGTDLAAAALITMNLKSLEIPFILCKAQDNTCREILLRLGADRVVIPEWDVADKMALGLTSAGVMEYIELSDEYGIVELKAPEAWIGQTIRGLELRKKYGANVIALRMDGRLSIPPDIDTPLTDDTLLVILSSYTQIEKIQKI